MKPTRFLTAILVSTSLVHGSASAAIRINEVHANAPGGADVSGSVGYEYVELISTTGGVEALSQLWLLNLDSRGGDIGRVEGAWNLGSFSTGSNGLLMVGLNYGSTGGGPWSGVAAPGTAFGNIAIPSGEAEFFNNNGFTLILVQNFNGVVGTSDTSSNDTTIDTAFWTGGLGGIIDSVGFNESKSPDPTEDPPFEDPHAPLTAADLSQASYNPDSLSRKVGDFTAHSAAAWFGGEISGATPLSVVYDVNQNFGGQPNPAATPGAPNAPIELADLRINEVSVNPPGPDQNFEYVEIISVDGGAVPTDGHYLLVVESNNLVPDRGRIREAWSLAGFQTGSNGILLLGNNYSKPSLTTRARTPFKTYVDVETSAGDPSATTAGTTSMGNGDLGENTAFTLLLVRGYVPPAGDDLDSNDDGQFDVTAWTSIEDSIGFSEQGTTNTTYALADVTHPFEPDNVSRVAGDMTPNAASAWYGGDYGGETPLAISFGNNHFSPAATPFRGTSTPGRPNLSAEIPVGNIFLNEITSNVPPSKGNSDDGNFEFVEFVSGTGTIEAFGDLTLLIVNGDATDPQFGRINEAIDVSGLSTGPNGIAVMGDSYNDNPPAGLRIPFDTAREDPSGLDGGDISPNAGLAVLLVTGFSGAPGLDLDADNDGVFDGALPWAEVIDGVGFGGIRDAAVADLTQVGYTPDNVSRIPGRTSAGDRVEPSAWYGGTIFGDLPTGVDFGEEAFGPYRGGVTRGFANHAAEPLGASDRVVINEVTIDPVNSDDTSNAEFIEIVVSSLDARSLSGYALVLLESQGSPFPSEVGEVLRVWELSGMKTGPNGLLILGAGYGTAVPYNIDPLTQAATPLAMQPGDVGKNQAFSLLLFEQPDRGLREGEDLDASTTAALDNDGVLNFTPWESIADSVGFREFDGGTSTHVGITFGTALDPGFQPDSIARIGSTARLNPNTAADWFGGELLGVSSFTVAYDPAAAKRFNTTGFTALATPGRHNPGGFIEDLIDSDLDGTVNLVEEAINANKLVPDPHLLPMYVEVPDGGESFPGLTYTRLVGGTLTGQSYTVGNLRYEIEVSDDLVTWESGSGVVEETSSEPDGSGVAESVLVRGLTPIDGVGAESQQFLRLKVLRTAP
ncbi:hypothetical protein BH23VER1_BH23VER1_20120 [soil metagenome]